MGRLKSYSKTYLYSNVSNEIGKEVKIKKNLCFYNPEQVYHGITENKIIQRWNKFMTNDYKPPKKKILLIFPCSTIKPYNRSRSYVQLYKQLDLLNQKKDKVHVMTISEPFGLVPEECYSDFQWYDCPGLFEWWCSKYGQKYDHNYLDKSIELLADNVGQFLKKASINKNYEKIIGFVRTYTSNLKQNPDHTHRRILELAAKKYKIDLEILPKKQDVKQLIKTNGRFAWDMYGVAHPIMLKNLTRKLGKLI